MTLTPVHIFLVVSAVWRLSSLFANEDGPFLIFKKIRSRARDLTRSNRFFFRMRLSEGLECEWCNSIWFASALVPLWYVFGDVIVIVLSPLAISTWAIAVKYIIQTLEKMNTQEEK
jgi:uncharacterized protein DUF1360